MTEKRDELYNAAMEAALHGRYVVAAALFQAAATGDDPALVDAAAAAIRRDMGPVGERGARELLDAMDAAVAAAAAALEAQRASDGATESPYPVRVFDPEASGDRDEQ